jgi:hypothetical protein
MHRVTRILGNRTTAIDQIADIHRTVFADDDVVSTGTQRVAGLDDHALGITGMADHIESAHNTVAMEISIVQSVLLDDIVVELIEVLVSEQLPRKKFRPTQAFQTTANSA